MADPLDEEDSIDMTGPPQRVAADLIAWGLSRMTHPSGASEHIEGREMLGKGLRLALEYLKGSKPRRKRNGRTQRRRA